MRISEHLYVVGGGLRSHGLSHPADGSVYVVDSGAGLIMVDAGSGVDSTLLMRAIAADGLDPRRVSLLLLTHGHLDHSGGAAAVHEISGCDIYAPADIAATLVDPNATAADPVFGVDDVAPGSGIDFRWTPLPRVVGLDDGDSFEVGPLRIRCHVLSGHSAADLVVQLTVDGTICLFTGDLVDAHGAVEQKVRPDFSPYALNASLERLESIAYDAILPGHGAFCLLDRGFSVRRARGRI